MAYTLETIQENYQTHQGLGLGNNVHFELTEEVITQCTLIPPPNPHLIKQKQKQNPGIQSFKNHPCAGEFISSE